MLLIGLSCSIPTIVFCYFSFSLLSDIGWYCGAGVFGLIGCISLSLSLALPTFLFKFINPAEEISLQDSDSKQCREKCVLFPSV